MAVYLALCPTPPSLRVHSPAPPQVMEGQEEEERRMEMRTGLVQGNIVIATVSNIPSRPAFLQPCPIYPFAHPENKEKGKERSSKGGTVNERKT